MSNRVIHEGAPPAKSQARLSMSIVAFILAFGGWSVIAGVAFGLLPWIRRAFADADAPLPAFTVLVLGNAFALGAAAGVMIVGLAILQLVRPRGIGAIVVHAAAIVLAMLVIVTLIFALFLPLPHLIESVAGR